MAMTIMAMTSLRTGIGNVDIDYRLSPGLP